MNILFKRTIYHYIQNNIKGTAYSYLKIIMFKKKRMHETAKSFFNLITDFQSLGIQLIVTLTLKDILLLMQMMATSRQ